MAAPWAVPTVETLRVQARTAYPISAASARIRVDNFRPFLREHNIELALRTSLTQPEYDQLASSAHPARKAVTLAASTARNLFARDNCALLMVHRLVLLAPLPGVDPPPRIDAYDFDDDLIVGSPAEGNRNFQWLKRESQRSAASIKRARLVIAANPFLADRALALNSRVEVIPSCVDPTSQAVHHHREGELVTIGWIGSHTTIAYLKPILPVISRLNGAGTRARLVVVGGDTGLRAEWIDHRPWSLATQAEDLADFDIGIMPLPDTAWTRGKSGYKLLQYFAAGVPAVASPVGMNRQLISEERGLLAESDEDWRHALTELIADVERRRANGRSAREFVEREYSYQRWTPELAALLRGLA